MLMMVFNFITFPLLFISRALLAYRYAAHRDLYRENVGYARGQASEGRLGRVVVVFCEGGFDYPCFDISLVCAR